MVYNSSCTVKVTGANSSLSLSLSGADNALIVASSLYCIQAATLIYCAGTGHCACCYCVQFKGVFVLPMVSLLNVCLLHSRPNLDTLLLSPLPPFFRCALRSLSPFPALLPRVCVRTTHTPYYTSSSFSLALHLPFEPFIIRPQQQQHPEAKMR